MKFETQAQVDAKVARLRHKMADAGIDIDTVLESNELLSVEYEFTQHRDTVRLVRKVWNKARNRDDRYVLCEANVAVWESFTVHSAISDMVVAYGTACEWEGAAHAIG